MFCKRKALLLMVVGLLNLGLIQPAFALNQDKVMEIKDNWITIETNSEMVLPKKIEV